MGQATSKDEDKAEDGKAMQCTADTDGVSFIPSPRFDPDDPKLLEYFAKHGYAVVKSVASKADVAKGEQLLWKFFEEGSDHGIKRDDVSTWCSLPVNPRNGIIFQKGVGQSEFLWHSRELPRVRQAFSAILGVAESELMTSFDSGNVFRPWHRSPEAELTEKTSGSWFHVDQGISNLGFQCVQGLVSYKAANEQTGGLVVIPGTHRIHDSFVDCVAQSKRDFVHVEQDDPILKAPRRLVCCEAGDLLLWDSRTMHCNMPAIQRPTSPTDELLRIVAYVCMKPRPRNADDLGGMDVDSFMRRRLLGHVKGATTSHWPYKKSGEMSGLGNHLGKDLSVEEQKVSLAGMSVVRRRLLGFRDDGGGGADGDDAGCGGGDGDGDGGDDGDVGDGKENEAAMKQSYEQVNGRVPRVPIFDANGLAQQTSGLPEPLDLVGGGIESALAAAASSSSSSSSSSASSLSPIFQEAVARYNVLKDERGEAMELWRQAAEHEKKGEINQAVEKYRRAGKLYPPLASI